MSPRTQELPLSNNLKISDHSNMSIPFTCFFSIIIACSLVIVYPWHRHTFATLSFVAEIFIFLYVGMDALDIEKWRVVSSRYSETRVDISKSKQYPMICNYIIGGLCIYLEIVVMLFFFFNLFSPKRSVSVSASLLVLILVGRAAFVFPLSFVSNLTKKHQHEKISFKQQVRAQDSCFKF